LGFLGVAITLWQLAEVILTFGEEMKNYNKAVKSFFTSLRFGVASPPYPKTPLRKNTHYRGVRQPQMSFPKISRVLIFAPFFVTTALVLLALFSSQTGVGPGSNVFAYLALLAIALGLLIGGTAACLAKSIWVWWRVLAGLLYIPTTIFSLLAAGF
jgi:hypothetical protein